jgi:hypothetical protein
MSDPLIAATDTLEPAFPGFTTYERGRLCCCSRTHIAAIPATFWGHWEVSLGMPSFVCLLIVSSYGLAAASMVPRFPLTWAAPALAALTILFVFFLVSYVRIITDGPGYFPFYWPLTGRRAAAGALLGDDSSPSGIVSSEAQRTWARGRPRPNRCILSGVGRRIVVRPDHFCGWSSSWIGKRNHKFFVLFNSWGSLYILSFMVVDVAAVASAISGGFPLVLVPYFLYLLAGLLFLLMTCMFVSSHCQGMCRNQTSWEEWNKIDLARFNRGCLRNTEDMCGDKSCCCCWCCPVSPWKGITDAQIVAGYRDYGKTPESVDT